MTAPPPPENLIVPRGVEPGVTAAGSNMPRDVLKLIRALYGLLATHEALAAQDVRKANDIEREGRYGEAEVLRALARNHRIRVLEVRAHIGLFEMGFGPDGD